jgi:uncharacterized membrane protein
MVDRTAGIRSVFKSYATSATIGLLLGFATIWWVRPDTSAGAVFLVLAITLVCSVIGTIVNVASRKPSGNRRKAGRK